MAWPRLWSSKDRAELARLRESEALYRLVADHVGDLIIQYDAAGIIRFVSSSASVLGYRPQDMVGRPLVEFGRPESAAAMRELLRRVLAGEPLPGGAHNEFEARRADGSWIWMQGNPSRILDAEGRTVGMVTVMRDVTERRALEARVRAQQAAAEQASAQLADSELRYRLLAEASPDIIIRYDIQGWVEYVSPAVRRYGVEPGRLIGRNAAQMIERDQLDRNDTFMADLAAGRPLPQGARNVWRSPMPGGRSVDFEGATNPIVDDGKVVGAISVLRDVTERVALEEKLRRKQAEAEAAVVAKSEFLANMSHEIRTPLTAVIGFAGLLAKVPRLPTAARLHVERIARGAESLNGIVNNVLDFSKVEAGQIELRPEPTELASLVVETMALVEDQAAAKGLTLNVEVAADAPGQVMADAGRVRQVLANLLTNAVKFTEHGEVVVSVGRDAATGRLRIAVRDTGIGVPLELSGRLFQRFSQIDGSNARRFGGAGLGLAISKGLVELMGGEIGFASVRGEGSTFWFTLAALAPPPPPPAALDAPPRSDRPERRARVLVVDDAPVNRELILALLGPFDLELVEAEGGLQAVKAAEAQPFELVLMDLQMPGMDGIAAARAIRSGQGPNRDTPIIAVSASVQPADVEACRAAGMNDHVPKPISARELLGQVARWTTAPEPALQRQAADS